MKKVVGALCILAVLLGLILISSRATCRITDGLTALADAAGSAHAQGDYREAGRYLLAFSTYLEGRRFYLRAVTPSSLYEELESLALETRQYCGEEEEFRACLARLKKLTEHLAHDGKISVYSLI